MKNNSNSNILGHLEKKRNSSNVQPLKNYLKPAKMNRVVKERFTGEIASLLAEMPTISTSAGVKFANKLLSRVQRDILQASRPLKMNFSRKKVGSTMTRIGQERKERIIKQVNAHLSRICVVFDHWSRHGRNFFGGIVRTSEANYSNKEYVTGFFYANEDKRAEGYIKDISKDIKVPPSSSFKVNLMGDNCRAMLRAGRISKNFKKVHCVPHVLAKIDEKIHQLPQVKAVDDQIWKLNGHFNYRHRRFGIKYQPTSSKSDTRGWRTFLELYSKTVKNYSKYQEIKLNESKFPQLPDYQNLVKLEKYQIAFCSVIDMCERKTSNLRDQVSAYIQLRQLSLDSNTQELIGDSLFKILSDPAMKAKFLSKESLLFCFLARVDFLLVKNTVTELDIEATKTECRNYCKILYKEIVSADLLVENSESEAPEQQSFQKVIHSSTAQIKLVQQLLNKVPDSKHLKINFSNSKVTRAHFSMKNTGNSTDHI